MYSTIRDKYNLTQDEKLANGWDTFEFEGKEQVYMDVELICRTTTGNLSSYSRNINDKGVLEFMRGLKSNFKKVEEYV